MGAARLLHCSIRQPPPTPLHLPEVVARKGVPALHRTYRATSPTTSGRPAHMTSDSAPLANPDGIFLSGALHPLGNLIPRPYCSRVRSLARRGFDRRPRSPESGTAWMCRTSYPQTRSSHRGQSRVPSMGIPSRESIEPSDPIEWVRAPPNEPLRALYVTCPRTTSRPLSTGARTST
jgi:hypothetical protein